MIRMPPMNGLNNFKATWSLLELISDDPHEALIALFASDEPIEAETRRAILEALTADRTKDPRKMKLRIVRPRHRPRTQDSELELIHRQHSIGAETVALLDASGAEEKNIVSDMATKHGISETEVRNSVTAWRERKFTVSRQKRK